MIALTPEECRVLGVMVEKAQTTPGQYPMSLNAVTVACNQKNNRDPIVEWDEDTVFDALDRLRRKNIVREVSLSGSRVAKFRHVAREILSVTTEELVLLAELLLRGPQSVGELRGRAGRMAPLGTLEDVERVLDAMRSRAEPLVQEIPGGRTRRFAQLLCPALHPLDSREDDSGGPREPGLGERVARLEAEVRELKSLLERLG